MVLVAINVFVFKFVENKLEIVAVVDNKEVFVIFDETIFELVKFVLNKFPIVFVVPDE